MEDEWIRFFDDLPWPDAEAEKQHGGLHGKQRGDFFRNLQLPFNRCLAPEGDCSRPGISAHTVQNARTLELLQRDGHLKTFKQRLDREGKLSLAIENVGRNYATTFEGFCSQHDTSLFLPIDTRPLDISSPEQLFLLAYRAVAREIHAQMSGALRMQQAFQDGVGAGRIPRDQPSEPGMLSLRHMIIADQGYKYKHDLDAALLAKDYSPLQHVVLHLPDTAPSIATAACFTVPNWTQCLARVTLNVLPISGTESVAIFSFTHEHGEAARSMLDRIFESDGYLLKYLLSKLVLARCENSVFSPHTFDLWTEDQINAMSEYFSKTTSDYFEVEDARLYLFREF
jgi:hypothetical protein